MLIRRAPVKKQARALPIENRDTGNRARLLVWRNLETGGRRNARK